MPNDLVTVQLKRDSGAEQWGFNLSGGKDDGPLTISEIKTGSIAEKLGLKVRDIVVKINNTSTEKMTSHDAEAIVVKGENQFVMMIERSEALVEDPRYEGLDEIDRAKVGNNDVSKPTLRRDWNCPWVKRDGKGLKSVVRNIYGTDPTPAPVKTSQHHFYSEPHSILAPEGPPIDVAELERAIAEKIREDEMARNPEKAASPPVQQQQVAAAPVQQPDIAAQKQEDEYKAQEVPAPAEPVFSPQPHHERNVSGIDDEDSCPPDLEEVSESVQAQPELDNDVAAAAPAIEFNQNIVRELTLAIKESMQNYQDMGDNYEPSADELIDVLKNLENLAAVNPALYRAIVDQIKVPSNSQLEDGQIPQQEPQNEEVYEEVGQPMAEPQEIAPPEPMNGDEVDRMANGNAECEVMASEEVVQDQQVSAEEVRKTQIRQQVEKEHEDQMRALKHRVKKEVTPPPPPKTITVMAGSRNQPSWPIYSGVPNAGVARKVELTAGSVETEEELARNRLEVAQNAGLKHVEVINGDEAFYPQPMKDYDYPWAGSLRPVSKGGMAGGRKQVNEPGHMPWAGSLRHVDQNKGKRRHAKHDDDDDMYGNAPWMGTLRHVTHENKVAQSYKSPQFKKYPDEDAPNPFQGSGGRSAKPSYPLTPAAIAGKMPSLEERNNQMEDVDRIRSNLRETRTVSSSLLKVLMPKLLKEHESKYEPLGHDESLNIMEEILAMQIGLNADQKVEDNDEAEQIIRAITHGEIDQKVYSQMADDLESAAQQKRKEVSKKKVAKKTGGKKKKVKKVDGTSAEASATEGPSASEVEPSASESNLVQSAA